MLWVQDSRLIKSTTPCPIVHFSVVISRKLTVIVVGASLLFLIANSLAEPHSTKALAPDHQNGLGTDTHFPKTAYQWGVEQELTSPRSVVKFEVPIRRIEDGERRYRKRAVRTQFKKHQKLPVPLLMALYRWLPTLSKIARREACGPERASHPWRVRRQHEARLAPYDCATTCF